MQSKSRIIAGVITLAALVYGVAAAAPPYDGAFVGSGITKTENRVVRDFHAIWISGASELTITQGDRESLSVEAESNILPLVESRVENGVLYLGLRGKSVSTNKGVHFRLTLRRLDQLNASGASDVTSGPLQSPRLAINLSGASSLDMAKLKTSALKIELSGASNVHLAGTADQQNVKLLGASEYRGEKLMTHRA